ncbi:ankyrin repeat domain-containing protein SOWAHA [Onthophagus taurus]|uniref:ankyrin repeat domain-containing protein SOWAHA n=1 Tax=Onthophagus taurus TaxID=166361 RepID=UPI0039BEC5FE
MAASELSIEQIHKFLLEKGGIVPNRDVVRHFRGYLTDRASQDDARIKFKRYVNVLATTKSEDNEKFLILRPKYSMPLEDVMQYSVSSSPSPQLDPRNAIGIPVSPSLSIPEFIPSPSNSPAPRQPPPYRPPPPVTPTSSLDSISISSSCVSINDDGPVVPPRRKIIMRKSESDSGIEDKLSVNMKMKVEDEEETTENDKSSVSVKERTQKFNRMASVDDELSPHRPHKEKKKKEQPEKGVDEDDGAAVMLLEPKRRAEWYVTAAKGDYHLLVKLASEEPRFVKLKDPFTVRRRIETDDIIVRSSTFG